MRAPDTTDILPTPNVVINFRDRNISLEGSFISGDLDIFIKRVVGNGSFVVLLQTP